jgi:lysophospholipase L1-like esterase
VIDPLNEAANEHATGDQKDKPAHAEHARDGVSRRRIPLGRKLFFAGLIALVFFLGIEGLLRLAGFQVVGDVERMAFTFPIDDYNQGAPEPFLRRDPVLFWTPRPGVLGHNSKGFYGPEFDVDKDDGVFRVVCLGDSCTHFGNPTYPGIFQQLVNERYPDKRVEVINVGVIGYTSFQGRTLMETRVVDWDPDLVTVYFGWNDHWLARGLQDKQQSQQSGGAATEWLTDLRSVQLARMLTGGMADDDPPAMRVEPKDYRDNLTAIATMCDQLSCDTWFMTAPHALNLSIPDYLYTSGEVADPSALIPLHQSYNEIVREVAESTQSELIDLAQQFDRLEKQSLFLDDHIHLTLAGRRLVAETLVERLRSLPEFQTGPLPGFQTGTSESPTVTPAGE